MSKGNSKQRVCVMIACMFQDKDIIDRSNVQTDVVVVNQCDTDSVEEWDFKNKRDEVCHAKFISTTERGLSRSRNMGIRNSESEICLVCDDDEHLEDDYGRLIEEGYNSFHDAEVVIFSMKDGHHVFPTTAKKMDFVSILRSNSQQITFKREGVDAHGIVFDTKMGSGTGNGGGEEIKFMLDCRKNKLKMYYHPNCITTVLPSESQWFHGYTDKYFINLGWMARHLFGPFVSLLYLMYYMFAHRKLIKKDNTVLNAMRKALKGWGEKR